MPFYKDSMSNGNLYIEFLIDFPAKGSITPQKAEKLINVFGKIQSAKGTEAKKIERKIIEEYDESDLNESPEGGKVR